METGFAVWPAVLQQIKDCNIVDYSIFLDETSMTLFATMKYVGQDYDADMEKMKGNPIVREWWYVLASLLPVPPHPPDTCVIYKSKTTRKKKKERTPSS
jgi:L-rhamnose mutarotase